MPDPTPLYLRVSTAPAVERIYDAALDPARLPQAIEAMASATGAMGGMIGMYDVVAGRGHAPAINGLDPGLLQLYEARFQLNPLTRWVARHATVGRAVSGERDLPIERVQAEDPEFVAAILKPQDLVSQSLFTVRREGTVTAGAALMFTVRGRSVEPEVLRRHTLLGRHLARAVDLMVELDTLRSRLQTTEDALDRVRCAVFVVDAQATILYANRAARRLLAEADGLTCRGRQLAAAHPAGRMRLAELIARAAGGGRRDLAAPGSLCLNRGPQRPPLAVVAVPGTPQRSPLAGAARQVLLFAADPAARNGVAAELLRESFRLTDREIAVALATVRLASLPAAAAELRIAPATARSHLQRVFDKTGTRNQVALAQLIAALGTLPNAPADAPDPTDTRARS
jgi:DNA-binding CsgD family transcriptional regulator